MNHPIQPDTPSPLSPDPPEPRAPLDYSAYAAPFTHVRPATKRPGEGWMVFGEPLPLAQAFILNQPGDTIRVVGPLLRDAPLPLILCNEWRSPTMPAPAFYYYVTLPAVSQPVSQDNHPSPNPTPGCPSPLPPTFPGDQPNEEIHPYWEAANPSPLDLLQHHVSGAIERGKAQAVEEVSATSVYDPTHDEMLAYLDTFWGSSEDGWEDEAEVAMYYFANDYHGGQWSNLYSALSTSPYSPGPVATLADEGDMPALMYTDLQQRFAPQFTHPSPLPAACPRCHLLMRAPSLTDNGKGGGVICARCASFLDPNGWYLESGDQEFPNEDPEGNRTTGCPSPLPPDEPPVSLVPYDMWRCSTCGTINQKGQVVCSNYDLHPYAVSPSPARTRPA